MANDSIEPWTLILDEVTQTSWEIPLKNVIQSLKSDINTTATEAATIQGKIQWETLPYTQTIAAITQIANISGKTQEAIFKDILEDAVGGSASRTLDTNNISASLQSLDNDALLSDVQHSLIVSYLMESINKLVKNKFATIKENGHYHVTFDKAGQHQKITWLNTTNPDPDFSKKLASMIVTQMSTWGLDTTYVNDLTTLLADGFAVENLLKQKLEAQKKNITNNTNNPGLIPPQLASKVAALKQTYINVTWRTITIDETKLFIADAKVVQKEIGAEIKTTNSKLTAANAASPINTTQVDQLKKKLKVLKGNQREVNEIVDKYYKTYIDQKTKRANELLNAIDAELLLKDVDTSRIITSYRDEISTLQTELGTIKTYIDNLDISDPNIQRDITSTSAEITTMEKVITHKNKITEFILQAKTIKELGADKWRKSKKTEIKNLIKKIVAEEVEINKIIKSSNLRPKTYREKVIYGTTKGSKGWDALNKKASNKNSISTTQLDDALKKIDDLEKKLATRQSDAKYKDVAHAFDNKEWTDLYTYYTSNKDLTNQYLDLMMDSSYQDLWTVLGDADDVNDLRKWFNKAWKRLSKNNKKMKKLVKATAKRRIRRQKYLQLIALEKALATGVNSLNTEERYNLTWVDSSSRSSRRKWFAGSWVGKKLAWDGIDVSGLKQRDKYNPTLVNYTVAEAPASGIEESDNFEMSITDNNKGKIEYKWMNNRLLMTVLIHYISDKSLDPALKNNPSKKYGSGYLPVFQEVGLRYLKGNKWFDFLTEFEKHQEAVKAGTNTDKYSSEVKDAMLKINPKDILKDAILSTVDEAMTAYIHTHLQTSKKEWVIGNKDISNAYVDGLFELYGYRWFKKDASKQWYNEEGGMRWDIRSRIKDLFGWQWIAHEGNIQGNKGFGKSIRDYVSLAYGKDTDWPTQALSAKEIFLFENGGFRGIMGPNGAIAAWRNYIAAKAGIDEKHVPKLIAATKFAVAAYGVALGYRFVSYLFDWKTFGANIQRLAVAWVLGVTVPRAFFWKDMGEMYEYFAHGDPKKKGLIEPSWLSKAFWWNPEHDSNNPDLMDTGMYTSFVFWNMKMWEIKKYISVDKWDENNFWWKMSQKQYNDYIKKYGQGERHAGVAMLKSLASAFKNDLGNVARFLWAWLSEFANVNNTATSFRLYTSTPPYSNMTLTEVSRTFWQIKPFQDKIQFILDSQAGIGFNDVFNQYLALNTASDQAEFLKRIEEAETFHIDIQKKLPYIRYHFLEKRKDLFPQANITEPQGELLTTGFDDHDKYNQTLYDYITWKVTSHLWWPTAPNNPTSRKIAFQKKYKEIFDADPGVQTFLDTYLLWVEDATAGTGLAGLLALDAWTNDKFSNFDKVRINGTLDQWVLWRTCIPWDAVTPDITFPDPIMYPNTTQEGLFYNIPWANDKEVMIWIDSDTKKLYFWIKSDDANTSTPTWKRWNMLDFWWEWWAVRGISFQNDIYVLGEWLLIDMEIDWEPVTFTFKLNTLGKMISAISRWETKIKIDKNDFSYDAFVENDNNTARNDTFVERIKRMITWSATMKFEPTKHQRPATRIGGN